MKLAVTLLFLTVFRDKEGWQLDYQKACNFKFFSNKVIWLMRPLFFLCNYRDQMKGRHKIWAGGVNRTSI